MTDTLFQQQRFERLTDCIAEYIEALDSEPSRLVDDVYEALGRELMYYQGMADRIRKLKALFAAGRKVPESVAGFGVKI